MNAQTQIEADQQIDMYNVTARQAKGHLVDIMKAGLVPMLESSPGMGKSTIYRLVAKELNLKFGDHRVSSSVPEDYNGIPKFREDGTATFVPFTDNFPISTQDIPDGYDGWLTLMDEANSLPSKSVEAAMYRLVLDREIGNFKCHPNMLLGMAGNLSTDGAIVTKFGTAMQTRIIRLKMESNFDEWLEDVALNQDYDDRIIAYHKYKNGTVLNTFDPKRPGPQCVERTWEFMDRYIFQKEVKDSMLPVMAGTIQPEIAADFVQFCKVYKSLITIADVRADPEGCLVPQDSATRWAVTAHLMTKANDENFEDLATYADRFDMVFRVLFYRGALMKNPQLRAHPSFGKNAAKLNRYLNG